MKLKFGRVYRDRHTGLKGVAVARTEYENGCVSVGLVRLNKDETDAETIWFDEQRLVDVATALQVEVTAKAGGPQPTPPKLPTPPN